MNAMPNEDQAQADSTTDTSTGAETAETQDTAHDPDISGATNYAAYQALVDELQKPGETPAEEEEDTETEHAPEEGEEEEAEEAEESAETEDSPEEGTEDEEEEGTSQKRFRIRAGDDVEAEALALRKRHPDWSLKECIAKAEDLLGIKDAPAEEAAPVRTSETVTQEIARLRDERKQAFTDLDLEKAHELEDKISQLQDEKLDLKLVESQSSVEKASTEHIKLQEQYEDSERKAVMFYPDCTKEDSALTKKIVELDARMKALKDPLYTSPNKPFALAQAAAKELGIPMTDPKATTVAKKKVVRPVQPAGGSARATPSTSSAQKLEEAIGKATSPSDYFKLTGIQI